MIGGDNSVAGQLKYESVYMNYMESLKSADT